MRLSIGFRFKGSGFRVLGSGFRVLGSKVEGPRVLSFDISISSAVI
jgi:hypothetical protein